VLPDNVVDALAMRARFVTSIDTLLEQTRWNFAQKYSDTVVRAIQEVLVDFPDLAKEAREIQAAERNRKMLDAAAFKELRSRLVHVFDGCYDAVFSEMEILPEPETSGRKRKRPKEPRRRCQLFLKLPQRNVCMSFSLALLFAHGPSSALPRLLRWPGKDQRANLYGTNQDVVAES